MNRNEMLQRLNANDKWDIVIIGGGATGLGTAVDAASRGYKTLLLEQHDFAKGTSSRSTKLIHGGVRYLAQGNIKFVRESLKERGLLLKNAPHITTNISFVLPCYGLWQKIYYGIGLKLYDLMSGKWSLGKTKIISSKKTKELLPTIDIKKLSGGIVYNDCQFDDSRLAINLAQTAAEHGATMINYCKVVRFIKDGKKIVAVYITDEIDGSNCQVKCRSVINATGVFTDDILQMDDEDSKKMILPSQGIHLVFDKKYFPGNAAMLIPKTADGRVLFAVPWHDKVIVGTTDTEIDKPVLEPLPLEEEVDFILHHINKYLDAILQREDVLSVFTGLRPLVKKAGSKKTALMSRSHTLIVSNSGLVTITGGKWTTYRKMGEDAVNNAVFSAKLDKKACKTETLKIHGWVNETDLTDPLHTYGCDALSVKELCTEDETLSQLIHPSLPNIKAEIIWAVRKEMAMTIEDILARRTRILFLDARAAMEAAPAVARLMAKEMRKDDYWVQQQIKSFNSVAEQYLLS
jgi:glycerol-3-phosphate dehydrogenase